MFLLSTSRSRILTHCEQIPANCNRKSASTTHPTRADSSRYRISLKRFINSSNFLGKCTTTEQNCSSRAWAASLGPSSSQTPWLEKTKQKSHREFAGGKNARSAEIFILSCVLVSSAAAFSPWEAWDLHLH